MEKYVQPNLPYIEEAKGGDCKAAEAGLAKFTGVAMDWIFEALEQVENGVKTDRKSDSKKGR